MSKSPRPPAVPAPWSLRLPGILLAVLAMTAAAPRLAAQSDPAVVIEGSGLGAILAPSLADSLGALGVAHELLLNGHHEQAILKLRDVIDAGEEDIAEAQLLLIEALRDLGRYEEAVDVPSDDPRVQAAVAETMLLTGAYDEAEVGIRTGLDAAPQAPALHLAAGLLALERGQRDAALQELRRIPIPSIKDSTVAARELVTAGRAAWLRSKLPGTADRFQQAKDLFQEAYRRAPKLVEARLLAAALYKEKYESLKARSELVPIITRNPKHPEAALLNAEIDFADGRFRQVEDYCKQVLEVNPRHPGALELLAKIDLVDRDIHEAATSIEEGLLINPHSKSLRSLRAALFYQTGDVDVAEAEAAFILEEDAGYAEVFHIIGGALDRQRRYEEAAELYKRAIEIDPDFGPAANALGLLYMRDGREELAREWLDRGFELDRYNIRTYNMRLLFKKLDEYQSFETAHFLIRVDESDRPLVPLIAYELEQIYEEQCTRFGFEPSRKTIVELFPDHQLLSARLVGLPGVQGIPAACFGPVIASDSPRLWNGTNNWRTVMAHEFGHTLALERTRKLVPHWFTEGLSVVLEERIYPQQWDRMASMALTHEDGVLPFSGLNHGFTRSRNLLERNLAYYKSSFAVEYLIDAHGWDAMMRVLDGYAAGLTTDEVIGKELGIPALTFAVRVDSLFLTHVESAPVWVSTSRSDLMQQVQAASEDPENVDTRAAMALEWLKSGELETAVSEALVVLERDETHALARFVLGHAFAEQGELFAAQEYLEPLLDEPAIVDQQPLGYMLVTDLGMVYAAIGADDAALAFLEEAARFYPPDPRPLRELAEVHARAGRFDEAIATLERLVDGHPTEYEDAVRMAEIGEEAGRLDVAREGLRRALWIRPLDEESLSKLDAVAAEQDDIATRVLALEVLCYLRPGDRDAHAALVELCMEYGPLETARRFAPRLLELDPDHPVARTLVQ